MHTPALIWLDEYSQFSSLVVGEKAKELGHFHTLTHCVPLSFCIPLWTLKAIADANNLKLKLNQVVQSNNLHDPVDRTKVEKRLLSIFHTLVIPDELAKTITSTYHREFNNSLVAIYPSKPEGAEHIRHVSLGENNLIESILLAWLDVVKVKLKNRHAHQAIHELLFASPLVVERVPKASVSGVAHSHSHNSAYKAVFIESRWGESENQTPHKDTYQFDIRTQTLLSKNVGYQHSLQMRNDERVQTVAVGAKDVSRPSLSDLQVVQLAETVKKIKQQRLDHITVHWVLEDSRFFITQVEPLREHRGVVQAEPHKTITKVFISAGSPSKAQEFVTSFVDGVGVLRGEYILAQFGTHPAHVVKTRQTAELKLALAQSMQKYRYYLQDRPLVYRSHNLTSNQLQQLAHSTSYEPSETNPYLGFRGGMRITLQSAVFAVELAAIKSVLEKDAHQLCLMIPFIRNAHELKEIVALIDQHKLFMHEHFQLWLQLNTPENVLNLTKYLHPQISGVSVNIKSLSGLVGGYDPDDAQLKERYQVDPKIILHLVHHALDDLRMTSALEPLHRRKQFFVHMEDYSPSLLQSLVGIGVDGVIVKPAVAPLAKACIMEKEAARLADSYK